MIPPFPISPSAITWIKPSSALDILKCELKIAFQNDQQTPEIQRAKKRESTFTALGTAAHKFIRDVRKDKELVEDKLQDLWKSHMENAVNSLENSWELSLPEYIKNYETWPNYNDTKIPIMLEAKSIIKTREQSYRNRTGRATRIVLNNSEFNSTDPEKHSWDSSLPIAGNPKTDFWFEDNEKNIHGEADLIEYVSEGEYRIIDDKTGSFKGIPKNYKVQLLLYAYLFYTKFDIWPIELGINKFTKIRKLDLGDESIETASQQLVEELDNRRNLFNQKVNKETNDFEANPSSENCKHCKFQLYCSDYWNKVSQDWQHGNVVSLELGVNGNRNLATKHSPIELRGEVINMPAVRDVREDHHQWLVIVNYKFENENGALQADWDTLARYV